MPDLPKVAVDTGWLISPLRYRDSYVDTNWVDPYYPIQLPNISPHWVAPTLQGAWGAWGIFGTCKRDGYAAAVARAQGWAANNAVTMFAVYSPLASTPAFPIKPPVESEQGLIAMHEGGIPFTSYSATPIAAGSSIWGSSWNNGIAVALAGYSGNPASNTLHSLDAFNKFSVNGNLIDLRAIGAGYVAWFRLYTIEDGTNPPDTNLTTISIERESKSFSYNLANLTKFAWRQRNPDEFDNRITMSLATVGCRGAATITASGAGGSAKNLKNSSGVEVASIATGFVGQPAKRIISVDNAAPNGGSWSIGFYNLGAGTGKARDVLRIKNETGVSLTLSFLDVSSASGGLDDCYQYRIASSESLFTTYPNPSGSGMDPTTMRKAVLARDAEFRAAGGVIKYHYEWASGANAGSYKIYSHTKSSLSVPLATGEFLEINHYNDGGPVGGSVEMTLLPANNPLSTLELSTVGGTTALAVTETIDYFSDTAAGAATAKLRVIGSTQPKAAASQSLNFNSATNSGLIIPLL